MNSNYLGSAIDVEEFLRRLKLEAKQIDREISVLESQDLTSGQAQEQFAVSDSSPKIN
jgi:hypothetical protein